jgi:signal transduction histidine kinase
MKRVGAMLLALLLLVILGTGLLVHNALQSIRREEAMRHERVASRAFDALEAELTRLVEWEEQRSFLEYRYFYTPEGQLPGPVAIARSPLADPPENPWIVGYFQVEPDGRVHSPRRPRDNELPLALGQWNETPELQKEEGELASLAQVLRMELMGQPGAGTRGLDGRDAPGSGTGVGPLEGAAGRGRGAVPKPGAGRGGKDGFAPEPPEDPVSGPLAVGPPGSWRAGSGTSADTAPAAGGATSAATQPPVSTTALTRRADDGREGEYSGIPAGLPETESPVDLPGTVRDVAEKKRKNEELRKEEARSAEAAATTSAPSPQAKSAPAKGSVAGVVSQGAQDEAELAEDQAAGSIERSLNKGAARRQSRQEKSQSLESRNYDWFQQDVELAPVENAEEESDGSGWAVEGRLDTAAEPLASAQAPQAPAPAVPVTGSSAAAREAPASDPSDKQPAELPASGAPARADAVAALGEIPSQARTEPAEPLPPLANPAAATTASASSGRFDPSTLAGLRGRELRQPPTAAPPDAGGEVDVRISPFHGRSLGPDRLVLWRDVRIGDATWLQGLALRLPELTEHLEKLLLEGSELDTYLRLDWLGGAPPESPLPLAGYAHAFAHRFEDPFVDLAVVASLRPLPQPGPSPRAWVLRLAVLLALVALLGFGALYRMVAVALHFAERRSNFVAAVSHELKTPLTAIRMYSEILRDDLIPDEGKKREYYGTMAAESERLSRLIENVLELARLEKGTRTMNPSVGDVGPVLVEAVRTLSPHARERGFDLEIRAEPGLPAAEFDRDALLQVLINLVDNAIKFSRDANERRIQIEALREGERVALRVRDHGPGVPAQHVGRVFQPFFRGERELTRTTRGTGIGLALVKGLVEGMGGTVAARNHPQGGFEVSIGLRFGMKGV